MTKLTVEIWSDIACPWCRIGLNRLETALAGFAHVGKVKIRHHSYRLMPGQPVLPAQEIPRKMGGTAEDAGRGPEVLECLFWANLGKRVWVFDHESLAQLWVEADQHQMNALGGNGVPSSLSAKNTTSWAHSRPRYSDRRWPVPSAQRRSRPLPRARFAAPMAAIDQVG